MDNPHNHLNLGRVLRRLFAYLCSCQSGKRTNACCQHISAANVALTCPGAFRTAKKNEARAFDMNRPDRQQPTASGLLDLAVVTAAQAVTPVPLPAPATRDSRANTRRDMCAGLHNPHPTPPANPRAGYGAHLRVPVVPVQGNQGRGRGAGQPMGHPSGLVQFQNPGIIYSLRCPASCFLFPCSLLPAPCSLLPAPCSLLSAPCSLLSSPCSLFLDT